MKFLTTLTIFILSALLIVDTAEAQANEYQRANVLMQQQKFEEALPILESLYKENPRSYVFFDLYTDCLVNLKQFDEAEAIAREQVEQQRFRIQAAMKLAEILHLRGDRDQAMEIWMDEAEREAGNIQSYYTIGSSMASRQEYDAAINLYRSAQKRFGNETLFLNELANIYLQAGRFEESVNEYFRLIIHSPDQMSLVQQRFLRMRDQNLFEIAAFELEDQLLELNHNHEAYSSLYQLLTWLLLETEEYQRAFIFARHYENQTSYTIYSLFSLANQLLSARQFELATDAYEYYIHESDGSSLRYRSMEELAAAYTQWVQYLKQNNLENEARYRELYSKAYNINEELLNTAPNYDRIDRVYARIIDLSVDFYKDIEKAEYWYQKMTESNVRQDEAFKYYAEGRIALFKKDFTTARQTLTRADRATDSSNLSERARYYLSLSDFFAGDFEFAEIQLRSLERRHTSYYANDAIKLRMWIKNGKRADTTGALLKTISESMYSMHVGDYENAIQSLEPIMASSHNPFADDLVVELGSSLPMEYNTLVLQLIQRVLNSQPFSPLKERLLWDKANLVEQMLLYDGAHPTSPVSYDFLDGSEILPYNQENLQDLYEDLLMEFPDGFYATFAREKLQELEIRSI